MQKSLFIFLFCSLMVMGQETDNSTMGVQDNFSLKAGAIGAWASYEKRLSNSFSLNTELGYEGGYAINQGLILTTTLSVEPRYYFSMNNRIKKGKDTRNNAGAFFSLEGFYYTDFLSGATNADNVEVLESFNLVPKYGIRTNLTEKLNFEFGIGFGWQFVEGETDFSAAALDLRLGYNF